MVRFGLGSVMGAGAAGAYGYQQYQQSGFSGMLPSILPPQWQPAVSNPSSMPQIDALQNELKRLSGIMGDMARNSNRPTVVTVSGQGRAGWTFLLVPTAVGGVALYVYCRLTGSSVLDFFYVSRSSLTAFRNTMQESLTKVWDEMKRQKEELFKAVGGLGRKQEELGKQMADVDERLKEGLKKVDDCVSQVDSKVDHNIQQVGRMDERQSRMDSRLQDVHSGVTAANQGIYMLVSAVSEVTQRIGLHNSRTAKALKAYAEGGPAWFGQSSGPAAAIEGVGVRQVQSYTAPAIMHTSALPPPGGAKGLRAALESASVPVSASAPLLPAFSVVEEPGEGTDGGALGPDGIPMPGLASGPSVSGASAPGASLGPRRSEGSVLRAFVGFGGNRE